MVLPVWRCQPCRSAMVSLPFLSALYLLPPPTSSSHRPQSSVTEHPHPSQSSSVTVIRILTPPLPLPPSAMISNPPPHHHHHHPVRTPCHLDTSANRHPSQNSLTHPDLHLWRASPVALPVSRCSCLKPPSRACLSLAMLSSEHGCRRFLSFMNLSYLFISIYLSIFIFLPCGVPRSPFPAFPHSFFSFPFLTSLSFPFPFPLLSSVFSFLPPSFYAFSLHSLCFCIFSFPSPSILSLAISAIFFNSILSSYSFLCIVTFLFYFFALYLMYFFLKTA